MTKLAAARNVIDAKHASFKEKPEAERLPNMSPEALYRTIKNMETPRSGVASAERRADLHVTASLVTRAAQSPRQSFYDLVAQNAQSRMTASMA